MGYNSTLLGTSPSQYPHKGLVSLKQLNLKKKTTKNAHSTTLNYPGILKISPPIFRHFLNQWIFRLGPKKVGLIWSFPWKIPLLDDLPVGQAGAATQCSLMVPGALEREDLAWKSFGSHGFFWDPRPSYFMLSCKKKERWNNKKLQKLSDPIFLVDQTGVVWELAEALSVFAIGLPTIYVNVLKQDFGEFSSCMILKGWKGHPPKMLPPSWPPRMHTTYVQNSSEYLQCPSAYPTIIYSCFFRLQRSGWCRSVELELSQLYISISLSLSLSLSAHA